MIQCEDQAYGLRRQSKLDQMTDEEFAALMDIDMDNQLRQLEMRAAAKEVREEDYA